MATRTARTAEKRKNFLEALGTTASVTRSCKLARLPRQTAYDWREADADFAKAWDDARERGTDALEDEAVRRAHEGTLRPVFQGGKKVGTVRDYSDTLLIFTLKALRPDKFKDRAVVEHDMTDRLAERLDAARKKAYGKAPV